MTSETISDRLEFVKQMIIKLRQALLDGSEVLSISSAAGAVSYNRKEMEERLAAYEAELRQLENGANLSPVIRTVDMRGAMG